MNKRECDLHTPNAGLTDFLTVRDVQVTVLPIIRDAAREVGAKLVFADLVQSPRPVLWFCGSHDQIVAFHNIVTAKNCDIKRLWRGKLSAFAPKPDDHCTGLVYRTYARDGVIIHGATSGIEVEFCTWMQELGAWRAPRALLESEADATYLNALCDSTYLGVTLPMLENCRNIMGTHPGPSKVDLVYTWVDGADLAWLAKKAEYAATGDVLGAMAPVRFESGSELRHSVLSALRYFTDLGKIYIVTDGQTPHFLGDLLHHVTIIDHADIFDDPAHLPTFNSHAIAAQVHRIPELRQRFLYLNDDVLFARPMSAAGFFDEFGRSFQFPSSKVSTPHDKVGALENPVDAAARNNRALLQDAFGFFAFRKFKHTPLAINRDVMGQMQKDLPQAWTRTLRNRFRSTRDHAIAGHLYAHYAALTGTSVQGRIKYSYFDLGADDFQSRFDGILKRDWASVDTFCVNESIGTALTTANRAYMDDVLSRVFPRDGIVAVPPTRPADIAGSDGPEKADPAGFVPRVRRWLRRFRE